MQTQTRKLFLLSLHFPESFPAPSLGSVDPWESLRALSVEGKLAADGTR